jgi:hypothetical protein
MREELDMQMELFAAEVLPLLRGWGREPRTSRAKD